MAGTQQQHLPDQAGQEQHRQALDLLADAMSFMYPAALRAAAQLGWADQLAERPQTAAELAAATGADAQSSYRTLRLLATRGVFREDEEGRFHLTPRADVLRTGTPASVRRAVIAVTGTALRLAPELAATIRQGQPAFERVFGAPFFSYLASDQEAGASFHEGMASLSAIADDLIVAAGYDFPPGSTVLDVGGGIGGLLLNLLRHRDDLRGVLFDQQPALDHHLLGQLGADHRWQLATGDFFHQVPEGADVYLLKRVLHDWADEECCQILRNCRKAMPAHGRVLVIESVVTPGNQLDPGKALDLLVMVTVPGRERTETEFRQLLAAADLRLTRVVPTEGPVSIIEAVPA